jgi:hypothetical protein
MVCERLLVERQLVFFGFFGRGEQERDENGRREKRGDGCETCGRAGKGIERQRGGIVEFGIVELEFFGIEVELVRFRLVRFRLVRIGGELSESAGQQVSESANEALFGAFFIGGLAY